MNIQSLSRSAADFMAGHLVCICADCHKVRDEQGHWGPFNGNLQNTQQEFTHGFCPECLVIRQLEVDAFISSKKSY